MTHPHDIITINDIRIELGDRLVVTLDMPKLYDCTPISMPIHVIRGKKPGPVLCVVAAVHGDGRRCALVVHAVASYAGAEFFRALSHECREWFSPGRIVSCRFGDGGC